MMILLSRTTGWIGIDVGTSTVKVAQLVNRDDGWQLAASAVVARRPPWPEPTSDEDRPESSRDELSAARSLQLAFKGRRAAACLPMTLCDVHAFDLDLENNPRAEGLIRKRLETVTHQPMDPFQIDSWTAPRDGNGPSGEWTNIFTLLRSWGDRLCDDIAHAGWSCRAIDALPFALARAAELVNHDESDQPMAVLDWGYTRATLSIVVRGRPVYVRCLKNCGLRRTLETVTAGLEIFEDEAVALLTEHGLPADSAEPANGPAVLIHDLVSEPMDHFVAEIERSLEHYQYQRRTNGPCELILLGGGATLKRLPSFLSQRLGIPVRRWELEETTPSQTGASGACQCLFGAAAALSLLGCPITPAGIGS